jgi:histidyl-tRNA synthetase
MGDVTVRDFLIAKDLLPENLSPTALVKILAVTEEDNLSALKIANHFRSAGSPVESDISNRKLTKKINVAVESGVKYVVLVGSDEVANDQYTLKDLDEDNEIKGDLDELLNYINK